MGYTPYLADPSDVLVSRLFVEPEVLVQPKPNVIAIEPVREPAQVQQVLLQRTSDGGLNSS